MKHKKILLGSMSAVMAVAAPVATVVACGKAKQNKINYIQIGVKLDEAIAYAKKEATDKNKLPGATFKNPIEFVISNLIKQIFENTGKKYSSFKIVGDKLNSSKSYDLFGAEIKKALFNKKIASMDVNGTRTEKSLSEILKQDAPTLAKINTAIGGQLGNPNFNIKPLMESWEKGLNPMKGGAKFKDNAEKEAFLNQMAPFLMAALAPTITALTTNLYVIDSLKLIINSFLAFPGTILDRAGVTGSELFDLIKDINGNSIQVNADIKGRKLTYKSSKVKLSKSVLSTVNNIIKKSPTVKASVLLDSVRNNLLKMLKDEGNDKITLGEMMSGKSIWKNVPDTKKGGFSATSKLKENIGTLLKWSVFGSVLDIFKFMSNIADDQKATGSFLFQDAATQDKLAGASSLFGFKKQDAASMLGLLSDFADLYR